MYCHSLDSVLLLNFMNSMKLFTEHIRTPRNLPNIWRIRREKSLETTPKRNVYDHSNSVTSQDMFARILIELHNNPCLFAL